MEPYTRLVFAVLILSIFFTQGRAECRLSGIAVSQKSTGNVINEKPEFEVTISNNCICTQSDVKLRCPGFESDEQVDPTIFQQIDRQDCLVNGGLPIYQNSPISFKYAWIHEITLIPVHSQINCS